MKPEQEYMFAGLLISEEKYKELQGIAASMGWTIDKLEQQVIGLQGRDSAAEELKREVEEFRRTVGEYSDALKKIAAQYPTPQKPKKSKRRRGRGSTISPPHKFHK